jgi:diguanylate cyclase (GGDEF)-like protein
VVPEHEALLHRRDGAEFAVRASAAPIRNRDDRIIGAVLVFHDVSEKRRLTQQLTWQASHDALTGLPNRREFETRLAHALAVARAERHHHVLLYVDLDQFKVVNDTAGHLAGDALLMAVSALLRRRLRDSDTIARLGGDEFGVLLESCPLEQARRIAEELRLAIKDFRFAWRERVFQVGASIGLAPINSETASVEGALAAADVACYAAKDLGRDRVHLHHEDDAELTRRHGEMLWVSRITSALEEDRPVLYSQPIVPVRADAGLEPHYEMLVRLRDERGALVPPGAFLPAAERYGLMGKLDRWVLQNALAWYREHHGTGAAPEVGLCAINISGVSLADDELLAFVEEQLQRFGVPPERLCFEITETAAISRLARATRFIEALRAQGCRFALDDFGSGFSSFAYLKNLPVDYLKIDGNFIRDLARSPSDCAIVAAINQAAHALGIRTIAEWVENDATLRKLREIGVDYAQGLGIAAPVPLYPSRDDRALSGG